MKKKVTYIISDLNRALAFEWIATYLDKRKFDLSFILLNPGDSILEANLLQNNFSVTRIRCRGKKDWPKAWFQLYSQLKKQSPDIVHCHLQQASILGLSAAKRAGIKTRIHTRHHSSLHHVYFPKGVYWDKLVNRLSTHIVAISGEVKKILIDWEKVPAEKVILIPHGFLLEQFSTTNKETVLSLTEKYSLQHTFPIVGVISRFTEWKGVQYIIPAFREILKSYHDAILLLFNADGDYSKEIHSLLTTLPEHSYRVIKFEPEIASAYHLMNVCVHVPIDTHSEAFGQIYIEAMAAGIPLVATLSGIGNDILQHKQNAWIVAHKNSNSIIEGIKAILSDINLQLSLIANGQKTAKDFSLQKMITNLNNLYENA
ncbi:MAG: glycosyltransferase family 4 protein [Bacteroidota bacterium]